MRFFARATRWPEKSCDDLSIIRLDFGTSLAPFSSRPDRHLEADVATIRSGSFPPTIRAVFPEPPVGPGIVVGGSPDLPTLDYPGFVVEEGCVASPTQFPFKLSDPSNPQGHLLPPQVAHFFSEVRFAAAAESPFRESTVNDGGGTLAIAPRSWYKIQKGLIKLYVIIQPAV
jgi:hypothetical protein